MKNKKEISRRKFITNSTLGSIGTLGAIGFLTSCKGLHTKTGKLTDGKGIKAGITLRPYKLLCAVCAIGEGNTEEDDDKIKAIRKNPDIPVTLRCNAGDIFAYQDPDHADDTHGSAEFNRKRDLEILQRIDLPPGVTLPARIILHRIWDRITSTSGICNCEETAKDSCKGCPRAKAGLYEKGREISLLYAVPGWNTQLTFSESDLQKAKNAIIVPRTKEERAAEKRKSLEAMYHAEAIPVRPHILLCAICQYGDGSRPPFETDNLPEMIQFILKNPKARIKMAEAADWMMCAPCPSLNKYNACVNVKGHAGLTSQLRDVRVLHVLDLRYGDVINAQELYKKILQHIPSSAPICGSISKGVQEPSVWDDECGHHSESLKSFVKGRELLIKEFGFNI
ncbi:MAG: DUF1284 domain-containing protein [Kiritimatiellae bacterium]|nr:DUF1284 domain-containing protein [Kiritimatiellia bacterium]MDD5522482.1 DUF1284 domain-containing protein [Kiritimatiellia bacterium]